MTVSVTRTGPVIAATTDRRRLTTRWFATAVSVALFVAAVTLVSGGLRALGAPPLPQLVGPVTGSVAALATGLVATLLFGSSTITTALTVAVLASGAIGIDQAIWIVLGSGLGTSLPCIAAAARFAGRPAESARALTAATVHDLQQLLALAVLAPLELCFHLFARCAALVAGGWPAVTGHTPAASAAIASAPASTGQLPVVPARLASASAALATSRFLAVTGILAGVLLCVVAVRTAGHFLQIFMVGRSRPLLVRALGARPLRALGAGAGFGLFTQSPAAADVMLVRFAGAGTVTPAQVWWVTLGTNLGVLPAAVVATLIAGGATSSPAVQLCVALVVYQAVSALLLARAPGLRPLVLRTAAGLADALAARR